MGLFVCFSLVSVLNMMVCVLLMNERTKQKRRYSTFYMANNVHVQSARGERKIKAAKRIMIVLTHAGLFSMRNKLSLELCTKHIDIGPVIQTQK